MPEVVDWESIITSRARKLDLKSDESSRGSDTDDADIDDGDDSEEDDAFFGVRGYTKEGSLLGREQENRVRGRRNTSGKEPQGEGWEGENDDEDAGEEDATVNAEGYELSDYRLSGGSDDYTQTDGKLVIGLIGHTNVGKSSLVNALFSQKVVSTSQTPGHTKHLQTIHLSPHVVLCDCPGIIFPSMTVCRELQVISGMYKVAQVQDPWSAVKYLAERVDLVTILGLERNNPKGGDNNDEEMDGWSAWRVCEEYAIKHGFLTPRTGRPDTYRAANLILRFANTGNVVLSFKPPGFFSGRVW